MVMKNGNILCLSKVEKEDLSGFTYTKKSNFKDLIVIESSEEEVKVEDILRVPITSGTNTELEDVEYTIINIRDIIFIR